jgi:hypothetical protein
MNSQIILLDEELDHCRMELQASAELMLRSMAESHRLVTSAQKRLRHLTRQNSKSHTEVV